MEKVLSQFPDAFIVDDSIGLIYIPNFLHDIDCNHIAGIAYDLIIQKSMVLGNIISNSRTSSTAYIPKNHDEIMTDLSTLVANLTDKPINALEQFQVVIYNDGEFFGEHYDGYEEATMKKNNYTQREYTFFVYLNTVEFGGETVFPKLNLSFSPKKEMLYFGVIVMMIWY